MNSVKTCLLKTLCQTHYRYSASSEMHKYYIIKMITVHDDEVLAKLICAVLAVAVSASNPFRK